MCFNLRDIIIVIQCFLFTLNSYSQESEKKIKSEFDLQLIREYEEKKTKRNNEFLNFLQNILISGPDTTPVIQFVKKNKCLLSLKDYNTMQEYEYTLRWEKYLNFTEDTIPNIDVKTIQQQIVNAVLKEAFIDDQWNHAKNSRTFADSLNNEITCHVLSLKNEISDSTLRARYWQYYQSLFRQKNNSLYYVVTATDSQLLAEMLSVITINSSSENKCRDGNRYPFLKEGYTLDVFRYDSLPLEMKILADSLSERKWSNITKTLWGFYAMAVSVYNVRKEISFEEALGQLVYLPEINRENNTITDKIAYEFYKNNEKLFYEEDTLLLYTKIIPNVYNKQSKQNYSDYYLSIDSINGTICSNFDLPSTELFKKSNFGNDSCTTWFDFFNGKWKMCLKDIKPGSLAGFEKNKNRIKCYIKSKWTSERINENISVSQSKHDERSYRLFVNNFAELNSNKLEDTFTEIEKWAENNTIIHKRFLRKY